MAVVIGERRRVSHKPAELTRLQCVVFSRPVLSALVPCPRHSLNACNDCPGVSHVPLSRSIAHATRSNRYTDNVKKLRIQQVDDNNSQDLRLYAKTRTRQWRVSGIIIYIFIRHKGRKPQQIQANKKADTKNIGYMWLGVGIKSADEILNQPMRSAGGTWQLAEPDRQIRLDLLSLVFSVLLFIVKQLVTVP